MRIRVSLTRRIAQRLVAHAGWVLPEQRTQWSRAMRNEIEHLSHDGHALLWALGCVVASYIERISDMTLGTLRVSRWVLGLEMIMCFLWLTWMFGALASRGVYGFAGPLPIDSWFVTMLLGTAAGPIGLAVAFKSVVLDRPHLSRVTIAILCIPAAFTLLAYGAQLLRSNPSYPVEALGMFILFAALPMAGAAHLVYLSRTRAKTSAMA